MRAGLLVIHILAGGTGLLLAWPTLLAPKRRGIHTLSGRVYAVCTLLLCLTAFALVALDPARLWGLAILGTLTLAWAAAGVWIARTRPRLPGGWRIWHLNLMCSSVISFVTAFAVQMTGGSLLAWLLPTVVGSPLIAWRTAREVGRRPAAARVVVSTGSSPL